MLKFGTLEKSEKMLVPVLLFCLGLVLLIKGGDYFVDGAVGIAHRFHLPEILIGATIVSIGTTLPEVMVSATSALSGHGEIAYGNAIGSIICNTSLIAAVSIVIAPCSVNRSSLKTPVIFFFIAAFFYMINAYVFGSFSRISGIILLLMFVLYTILTVKQMSDEEQEEVSEGNNVLYKNIFVLILGAVLITIGSNLLIDNGTLIAEALGVSESVIALTFIALGTSLPELVTAVTSLIKGHGSLSLGNIIGANLFNLVLVTGTSASLSPFTLPQGKVLFGMNASLILELPVMIGVMMLLCLPALIRGKLTRVQGVLLLCIYMIFTVSQFII